jgi:hypothetical protein
VFEISEINCVRLDAHGYAASIGEAVPDSNDNVDGGADIDEMMANLVD